ncbi:MAG: sarcosine oxidase subunit gamma [Rhodospirillaceae bacterium]|jgi:sarcosine oxidase, subunit gamma|nr:sarcosine oxidase subunit gamma [Rhodospirillaceae bacterium]MBT5664673.1 sarcosine oxidase subunit gamma [Rhodospirillaceae bacterium]MBT5810658.1 sarcosine oxidase subunit gamma [Rhodospirillaceae bacterium]
MADALSLTPIQDQARLSLRINAVDAARAKDLIGAPLPGRIGQSGGDKSLRAICLGPDEWVLLLPTAGKAALEERAQSLSAPHSLVDVSHRYEGLILDGPAAIDALHMGCPLNLRDLAIGGCTRTLFDSVEIILLRLGESCFCVEFGRSFADYMTGRLNEARRELERDSQE